MENIEVERRLQAAISALRSQDSHLVEVDASERSITHRLAVHLERLFPGWDVDCEYNRDRRDHKTINLGMAGIRAARRTGKVYPDCPSPKPRIRADHGGHSTRIPAAVAPKHLT